MTEKEEEQWREISGEYYDLTKTMKPESPYNHPYHQILTMKLLISILDNKGGINVCYNFEEGLQLIKKIDNITREISKIIYLVGWQYNGHDDKYPAMFEVNKALKRASDDSARESFMWFADEARKDHTKISVHINLTDAYKNSPL